MFFSLKDTKQIWTKKAQLEVEKGRIYLVHNGEKYFRYGSNDDKRYWRCRNSCKYECKARITTRIINGQEMIDIESDEHNHEQLRITKSNVNQQLKKYQNKNHIQQTK